MIDEKWLEDNADKKSPFEFERLVEQQKMFLRMGEWKVDPVCGLYSNERNIRACPVAVLPVALYQSAEIGGSEKVELKFWKFGRWQSAVVDREMISSRTKIVGLSNLGIEVTSRNAGHLMDALNDMISNSLDIMRHFTCCSHMGWHNGDFVPYSSFIVFDTGGEYRHIADCVNWEGSAEQWSEFMFPLFGSHRFRLAMAASFASPLIEIIGENPFVFHLWGRSGSGKTVTAMCAASVWGNPQPGSYMKSLNMTVNALLTTASVLKNLPFIGDELQTIRSSGEGYDRLIMTACEGINRGRMNRSQMEKTLSWKNSFIFTGEEPVTGSSSGAGAINRVIQVEASEGLIPGGSGNSIVNFIKNHYGEVGRLFIENLSFESVRQLYDGYCYALRAQAEEDGVRTTDKQMNAMALLLTADSLVNIQFFGAKLKELQPEEVFQYLADPKEVDNSERAYEFICNVISANGLAFTQDAKERWGIPGPGDSVYINNSILERELRRGSFEPKSVKRGWAEKGYLKKNELDGKYRHCKSVFGTMTSCTFLALPDGIENEV